MRVTYSQTSVYVIGRDVKRETLVYIVRQTGVPTPFEFEPRQVRQRRLRKSLRT